MVVLTLRVMSNLKDHRTEAPAAPSDCAKLFWVVVFLVDEVNLIEYFLRLLQADAVLYLRRSPNTSYNA